MSKKLKKLLEKLNVENIDEVMTKINADDDSDDIIETLLTSAQSYAKPFLQAEFKAEFDAERKSLKGKYFKDAAQKVNRIMGNKLTNSELEDVMKDPENEGKTFEAVIEKIKEKVADKTGVSETELQKMLDLANGEKATLQDELKAAKTKFDADLASGISKVKLDAALVKKLIEILPKHTNMNPAKAADLIMGKLNSKAILKLKDDNDISLHDTTNPDLPLKKNDTTLQTLDGLIGDLAKEYELPVAKSPEGTQKNQRQTMRDDDDKNTQKITSGADALANAMNALAN